MEYEGIANTELETIEKWEKIYKSNNFKKEIELSFYSIIDIFKERKMKRVLDLGCGNGRHLTYLSKQGFETVGVDISLEALKISKNVLDKINLEAILMRASIYEPLPFRDKSFDGVISIRTLHHSTIENIRNAIQEIKRVVKNGGLVYVTLRKEIPKEKRHPFIEIAPRTYIPLEGKEKGIIHYLFDEKSIKLEFKHFNILQLKTEYGPEDWEAYYCVLMELP